MFEKKQQPRSEDTSSAMKTAADTAMGKDSIREEYPPERRSAPNFAITEDDLGGYSVNRTRLVFSDEDQKMIDTLSGNERQEYVSKLIEERKYTIEYLW